MKIAVTHENGQIFGHFGHTPEFKVYEVKDGEILSACIVATGESGHGALAGLLDTVGAELLICGGIGGGARMALAAEGIALCAGVSGDCDEAVKAYLEGKLVYSSEASCSHHHEHGEEHACGHHHEHGEEHACGHHHEHGEGHTCHCHD